jgi:hypothetical protein
MIIPTDQWKRPIIKVNGQAITKPQRAIELDPTIEETLIRMGVAVAFDPSAVDDAIEDESEVETNNESELGLEDDAIEDESDDGLESSEEPVKKTKARVKK